MSLDPSGLQMGLTSRVDSCRRAADKVQSQRPDTSCGLEKQRVVHSTAHDSHGQW